MRKAVLVALALGLSSPALAQFSTGSPAGRDPSTAPAGTEGRAGLYNEEEAIKGDHAIIVAPDTTGTVVTPSVPPSATELPSGVVPTR